MTSGFRACHGRSARKPLFVFPPHPVTPRPAGGFSARCRGTNLLFGASNPEETNKEGSIVTKTGPLLSAAVTCMLLGSLGATAGTARNVALGKLTISNIAESRTYSRSSGHLTDGNRKTDAYPGAFSLDYTVNLTVYTEGATKTDATGFEIDSLVIDWGKYGRHFPGVKRADGSWAPAAYKADYVHWYQVDYATGTTNAWKTLHVCSGRPTDEDAKGVQVERTPNTASFSEGEVITRIKDINLHNVTRIRIRARGRHWIGIHELNVFGRPSPADDALPHG